MSATLLLWAARSWLRDSLKSRGLRRVARARNVNQNQEVLRLRSAAAGFLAALLAIFLGGLASSAPPCISRLFFSASMRLMTWASSWGGGVTISLRCTL